MIRSQEWYTHPEVIALAQAIFGEKGISLDPFANPERTVPAKFHIVKDESTGRCGFKMPWSANDEENAERYRLPLMAAGPTVFVNGPWALMEHVVDKCYQELDKGRVSEILILAPSRTDRPWSQALMANGALRYEPAKRWHYMQAEHELSGTRLVEKKGISHPSHLYYLGDNPRAFIRECTEGVIVKSLY